MFARNAEASLEFSVSVAEGGSPSFGHISYGGSLSPEDYGLYNDDDDKFSVSFELDQLGDACATATATVTGTGGRMYLAASEDFGPYHLDAVDVSITGQWQVDWLPDACE